VTVRFRVKAITSPSTVPSIRTDGPAAIRSLCTTSPAGTRMARPRRTAAPSFPESPAENDHAEQICPAEARIAHLVQPGPDSVDPKPVHARRKRSEGQRPDPRRHVPALPANQARGDWLVVLGHGARKQCGFALKRMKQFAAGCAFMDVRGQFARARRIELPLEVEQAGHFV